MNAAAPLSLPQPAPRAPDSHKGTYGTVLVVAGCRRYPGAAILTALGAGRAGAGLVAVATPASVLPIVVPGVPFATVVPVPETTGGGLDSGSAEAIVAASFDADALVLGPGLGAEAPTAALVGTLLRRVAVPVALDADGLNAQAAAGLADLAARDGATVLLPHPGELARLDGGGVPRGDDERVARARALASRLSAVVVLKGHRTVVTDGGRVRIETAGNPGMATGGMGDVLAGAVGAFLALRHGPAEAAALAVHVHALAGDLAAAELGEASVLPQDVAARFGRVLRRLQGRPIGSGTPVR